MKTNPSFVLKDMDKEVKEHLKRNQMLLSSSQFFQEETNMFSE